MGYKFFLKKHPDQNITIGSKMSDKINYWDKMLSNQHQHSYLYTGDNLEKDLFEQICQSSGVVNPEPDLK